MYFPALLVTVVRDASGFFAFFPSSKKHKLSDVRSINDLKKLKNFFPDPEGRKFISSTSYAYGLSEENIISGSPASVRLELKRIAGKVSAPEIRVGSEGQEAILEFLENSPKYLSLQNLKNLSENFPNFLVLTTTRKIKGNPETASSFLVQRVSKGSTKTIYRKGIPVGRALEDVRVPPVVVDFALA